MAACLAVFLLFAFLRETQTLRVLELKTRDWRLRLRNAAFLSSLQAPTHVRSDRVVMVGIDDRALGTIEEPMLFWTGHFAEVLGALDRAGAAVVALDLQFQVSGDDFLRRRMARETGGAPDGRVAAGSLGPGDRALFKVLRSGRVLLLSYLRPDGSLQCPWPPYRFAAGDANLFLGNVEADPDGVVRRQYLYRTAQFPDGTQAPCYSLPFLAACRALRAEPVFDGSRLRIGTRPVVHDREFFFDINFIGPPGTFQDGPGFSELLERARANDDRWFAERFRDRVVLIGPTYAGNNDLVPTPAGGDSHGEMAGIEFHANALHTLLNSDFMISWTDRANLAVLLLLCLGSAVICRLFRPRPALVGLAGLGVGLAAGALVACARWNTWLDLATPLLALPVVYMSVFTWRYLAEDRRRRHLRQILGRYVSENVARELLKDASSLALGGVRHNVTILFCDLNDFTELSEQSEPEQIISMLNDYFTRMETVIFRHGGTLKQFVGDEIMVICGAPAADPDHAVFACRIALEMEKELIRWQDELRGKGGPTRDAKFGLHSGEVVAGNVGSPNRSEYATVGDVVNTASRIMGLSKRLGRRIVVSEQTRRLAGEAFSFEDLGSHELRGKSAAIRVFALSGPDRQPAPTAPEAPQAGPPVETGGQPVPNLDKPDNPRMNTDRVPSD
ncbi:MAG: CHASE2 domain-containing protein [Acidobacteria bacterium]|nr:CHASE2 domain-containing protein [Acidobacteriota bacterium]